jgi:hypothetical protein
MPLSFDDVRAIALGLPGVEEGSSYGTPGFRVRGKLLARLKEDGTSLVVRISFDERELLMEAEPETFYITDHYRAWPTMLVRLSQVDPGTLKRLLVQHWREIAPKTLVKAYDAERT